MLSVLVHNILRLYNYAFAFYNGCTTVASKEKKINTSPLPAKEFKMKKLGQAPILGQILKFGDVYSIKII